MARLTLQDLAHSYARAPRGPADYALKPLTHVWQDGGAYALLGPSGCGKTTLLNILSGLVRPSEGRILFDDRDVTDLATGRRNIAQVFQFPVVYDTLSVYDNLAFPLRNQRLGLAEIDARVRAVAAMIGMTDRLDAPARGLTADAKQKISLGRGMVRQDVAAILFDEPLTVIDPAMKWELRAQLKRLHREFAHTMIYVTHDQTEALSFADQVVVMQDGQVVQTGTPRELFERPAHTFVGYFIGSPGMNVLPARIDGTLAHLDGGAVPLGAAYAPQTAEIGVRPEFGTITDGPGLPIQVRGIEDVGRHRIVRATLFGRPLDLLVPETAPPIPADPRVTFDPAMVHVYAGGWRIEGTP